MSKRIWIGLMGTVVLVAAGLLWAQPGPGGRRGRGMGFPGEQGVGNKPPTAKNAKEKAILDVLDDLDRNQRDGNMNVPIEDGRLLRVLGHVVHGHAVDRRDGVVGLTLGGDVVDVLGRLQRAVPSGSVDVDGPHLDAGIARIAHYLRRRVKSHRLRIQ